MDVVQSCAGQGNSGVLACLFGAACYRAGSVAGDLAGYCRGIFSVDAQIYSGYRAGYHCRSSPASFLCSLTVLISDRGLLVATTKMIGYSGMVLSTIALVVTGRDAELIGALRQLRIPQPVIFFLSTVFRALELALAG